MGGGAEAVSTASEVANPITWGEVPSTIFRSGPRRIEAATYLTDGFGLRQRIESVPGVSVPFHEVASARLPPRLKSFVVPKGRGVPFMQSGQAFEARPRVSYWISAAMLRDADARKLEKDWLLLSSSGDVGRVAPVRDEMLGKIVSHHLFRIVLNDPDDYGWLYAYLRTPTFRSIAKSSQYGHIINHIEVPHLSAMPVVMPHVRIRKAIGDKAKRAIALREHARNLQDEANAHYSALVNPQDRPVTDETWQQVSVADLMTGRRRFEGHYHRADYRGVEALVRASATRGIDTVGTVSKSVELGNRFKRYFGTNATPYRSAGELFDVNSPVTKRIYSALLNNPEQYMLVPGQIVMACSGQTYGLLGRTMILTEQHRGIFGSHDLIRINPDDSKIRRGYLQTVLGHETYGRPLAIRYASGTSIPHLDPVDIREVPVPRFATDVEDSIADLCERSTRFLAEADALENEATADAEEAITDLTGVRAVDATTGDE
jgi:hypothetical protein